MPPGDFDIVFPYGNRARAFLLAVSPPDADGKRVALVQFSEPCYALLGKKAIMLFEAGETLEIPAEEVRRKRRSGQSDIGRGWKPRVNISRAKRLRGQNA